MTMDHLAKLKITCTGIINLKANSKECIATSTSLGENELWLVLPWCGSELCRTGLEPEPNQWFGSASRTDGSIRVQHIPENVEPVLSQFELNRTDI